ncbi:twin-arginine translocase subunit TatB [Sphingomonas sp. HDW15A]|uniref:Sec-independent protein translocase subunit TatA/TatB n=1 Tax=Sphingomonas sp. HDW15A TaxID=2714942 RepID=UPI00140E49B3|nr:twin-arginine translocase subunit TatB [Sphingomonas sp. HDW15A]QIK96580.1 twin-arginine translocase subunit TatB [Sphingomonas sp. HDW15A]
MFGVDTTEFLIVAIAALIFIGPKELPATMRAIGRWVGKLRGMARHFTSGIETMMREAELEEMEKTWREENARIMAQYPPDAHYPEGERQNPALPPFMDQPDLPLEAPPAPDADPTPPKDRELP